jgi:hypothetical protein
MWNGLSQQYERMSPEDQRTFNRWISANAILGTVFAVGMLAMAVAGTNSTGRPDAAIAPSPSAPNVAAGWR